MKVPVLLFHDVSPDSQGKAPGITISPRLFQEIIARLVGSGYIGISARDWWNAQNAEGVLPPKPVVITFDDGYASIAEYALPVLNHHKFSATIFVVTSLIGRTNEWDIPRWRPLPLMNTDELRFWAAAGFEIASHSSTHRDLTTLPEPDLRREIAGSRCDLSDLLGQEVVSFSYPYGRHNALVRRITSQNFKQAFSIQTGFITSTSDPMRCCRIEIGPGDSPQQVGLYMQFASSIALFSALRAAVRATLPVSTKRHLQRALSCCSTGLFRHRTTPKKHESGHVYE